MNAPKSIYINLTTMYVVEKGYPNAVEYVLKDKPLSTIGKTSNRTISQNLTVMQIMT